MEIIRNDDGSLVVPFEERLHGSEDGEEATDGQEAATFVTKTKVIKPGEGGYDEALAEWDAQQVGDREVVSTASGREQAMHVVHVAATSSKKKGAAAEAVETIDDPQAAGDALRHVLVGGVHAVEDFASEVAEAEGGDPLPAHKATKIIGEVLAELD